MSEEDTTANNGGGASKPDKVDGGLKRRQDSYLEAVCSPTESAGSDTADQPPTPPSEPKQRKWKTRQESYQAAIQGVLVEPATPEQQANNNNGNAASSASTKPE